MILDTCFIIDLMRESAKGENGPAINNSDVYISMFTLCELRAGAAMSKPPELELKKIEALPEFTGVLYSDSSFPVLYGEAEAMLKKKRHPNSGDESINRDISQSGRTARNYQRHRTL